MAKIQDPYCFLEAQSRNRIARDSNRYLYAVNNHWNGTNWGDIYISQSTDGGINWTNYLLYQNTTYAQYTPVIAIDSEDNIFIVWETTNPTINVGVKNICLIKGTWGSWGSREMVTDSASEQYVPSIAIDGSDNLHITWYGLGWGTYTTKYQIVYRKRLANDTYGSAINLTDVNNHQSSGNVGSPSICLDGDGDIHIVWAGLGWGTYPTKNQIIHIVYSGGSWGTAEYVTNNNYDSTWAVMAVDSSDNLHLVYHYINNYVRYQKKDSVWNAAEIVFGDSFNNIYDYNPCIALDASDNIYVTAEETGIHSSTIRSIVLREKIGANWQDKKDISVQIGRAHV